jgi:bifunctional non-homologous end joining protein LigD
MRFVVHEHKARRLHYDFRLEVEGVLVSWAIPKGPSLNPADKRLAVRVGDHPLSYLLWEGIIPEGHYGAGPVVVWDTGTYRVTEGNAPSEQLTRGKLTFELNGKKLKGGFTFALMARSKTGNDWLLIKRKDGHAQPAWVLETELKREKLSSLKVKAPPCETD